MGKEKGLQVLTGKPFDYGSYGFASGVGSVIHTRSFSEKTIRFMPVR